MQPKKVVAIAIVRCMANEMDITIVDEVGYSVRFNDKCNGPETRLKYLIDGMLLREAMIDPLLKCYQVILDEAHERKEATDVLLALLKGKVLKNTLT